MEEFKVKQYAPLDDTFDVIPDQRLRNRLETVIETFANRPNVSIPEATQDRNAMDATYNLFHNPKVNPDGIVATNLDYTLKNLKDASRVLVIQDTTDLNFSGLKNTQGLGHTDSSKSLGLKLHSSLAVLPSGQVAGLLTQQFWTRPLKIKGRTKDRRKREDKDKESYRWQDHHTRARLLLPAGVRMIAMSDREGDIYNWFAQPRDENTDLLVRVGQTTRTVASCEDNSTGTLLQMIESQESKGEHVITVPRADGRPERTAVLEVRFCPMKLQPPRHAKKRSQLREVQVWVVEGREKNPPTGQKPIRWLLVTTEPILTLEDAIRALQEYYLRWRIERFHYVCKSGFGVEDLQLETSGRLANAVAVFSQAAVRVLRLTYLARIEPELDASEEFDEEEIEVLKGLRKIKSNSIMTLVEALRLIAKLGGHLGRKGDGPPGLKVIWKGLKAFGYIIQGHRIAKDDKR